MIRLLGNSWYWVDMVVVVVMVLVLENVLFCFVLLLNEICLLRLVLVNLNGRI